MVDASNYQIYLPPWLDPDDSEQVALWLDNLNAQAGNTQQGRPWSHCENIRLIRKFEEWGDGSNNNKLSMERIFQIADIAEFSVNDILPNIFDQTVTYPNVTVYEGPSINEGTFHEEPEYTDYVVRFLGFNYNDPSTGITMQWGDLVNNVAVIDLRDFNGLFFLRDESVEPEDPEAWVEFEQGKVYSIDGLAADIEAAGGVGFDSTENGGIIPNQTDAFKIRQYCNTCIVSDEQMPRLSGRIILQRKYNELGDLAGDACPIVSNPIPVDESGIEYPLNNPEFMRLYTFGCDWSGEIGGIVPVEGDACKITIRNNRNLMEVAEIIPNKSEMNGGYYSGASVLQLHKHGQIIWAQPDDFGLGNNWATDNIDFIKVEPDDVKICADATDENLITTLCKSWGLKQNNQAQYERNLINFCTKGMNPIDENEHNVPNTQSVDCIDAAVNGVINRTEYDDYLRDHYCTDTNKYWRGDVCGCFDVFRTELTQGVLDDFFEAGVPYPAECTQECQDATYQEVKLDGKSCSINACIQDAFQGQMGGNIEDIDISDVHQECIITSNSGMNNQNNQYAHQSNDYESDDTDDTDDTDDDDDSDDASDDADEDETISIWVIVFMCICCLFFIGLLGIGGVVLFA